MDWNGMLREWNRRVLLTLEEMREMPNASTLTIYLKKPGMLQAYEHQLAKEMLQRDNVHLVNIVDEFTSPHPVPSHDLI
jgi:hypothetical protein